MPDTTASQSEKTYAFQAEVSQVLSLVIHSLYSNQDIFLRELVSNAADALDKLRFEAIAQPQLQPKDHVARIRLIPDAAARTLTITDTGIGMSEEQLVRDLGTVARSGTRELAEKLKRAAQENEKKDGQPSFIGQFGVGFYSGFLVADSIEVVSRAVGSEHGYRWRSSGAESFTIEPAERDEVGTSVVLHLKPDCAKYCEEHTLRQLVRTYSDFINYPIELKVTREGEKEAGSESFEAINQASALWTRPKKDITDAQYDELYRHVSHDWEAPLARTHFQVEGTQMFTGLLFVPKNPPFDLFSSETRHGVRLYVRRVFIMDDCEELLPRWLRFVRGVIDSDDLPLNVSRELLQDSAAVRTIRKQVIRRVLDLLLEIAENRPDDYTAFFRAFGPVLKEGLHFDPSHKDKLGKLMRYESTRTTDEAPLVSLDEYVKRMPLTQPAIYYAVGPSRALLDKSPQLEALKQRGFEVLLMTDGVDQFALDGLSEWEGKKFENASEADVEIKGEGEEDPPAPSGDFAPLLTRCKSVLDAHVSEARISKRLTDSPACLVTSKGGLPPHIERLIRAQRGELPSQKRILELNPSHPVVQRLQEQAVADADSAQVAEGIEMLFDQALLAEGSPLPDPSRFVTRVTALMQRAIT